MVERRIGAVIPVYNRERYIGPFLEMMDDFGVTCAVTLGDAPWTASGGDEVLEKDKTEKILDKYFSHMRILKGSYSHHKDSFNKGIEQLQDCDMIFVNDCDMFITLEDWNKGLEFIDKVWEEADVFAINFENMIKEYYFNHNYGCMAKPGGPMPIMAIKPDMRMRNMTSTEGGLEVVWDKDGPLYHHMRHCKPTGSGKKYCVEPTPTIRNMDDFTPAPKEIINRIIKWEKIIENL